jgi:hypothetical protein
MSQQTVFGADRAVATAFTGPDKSAEEPLFFQAVLYFFQI